MHARDDHEIKLFTVYAVFFIKYIFLLIPGDVMQYSATTMTGAMNASKQLENGRTTVNPPRNSKLFAGKYSYSLFWGAGVEHF